MRWTKISPRSIVWSKYQFPSKKKPTIEVSSSDVVVMDYGLMRWIKSLSTDKVEEDRSIAIEAAIVRIMKARKTLKHTDLVVEVMNQLTLFKPNPRLIKTKIEALIEREFLQRCPDDVRWFIVEYNIIVRMMTLIQINHSLIYSFDHSSNHLFIHHLIFYSSDHSFNHSTICSYIYSFIYLIIWIIYWQSSMTAPLLICFSIKATFISLERRMERLIVMEIFFQSKFVFF